MSKKKAKSSEVHAYVYIKEQLKILGWNVKNPAKSPAGEVYTQNECLLHPEIKKGLGLLKPENVVKLSETDYWVLEAKPDHKQLDTALNEACEYADKINKATSIITARIVTGVAGNDEDTYLIKHQYWDGKKYVPITVNGREPTGLLSKELCQELVKTKNPTIKDIPFIPEHVFLQKAESINEILHNGGINLNLRARYIAALTLCYASKTMPNRDNDPKELIEEINSRVEEVLEKEGKKEFAAFITLSLPTRRDNHKKIRNAIIQTFQELDNLNIRSAMNSSTDVLGKFYEVFLKYGNGAKEIGIVLTPRHITEFAADVVNVTHKDIVYDPTCGTAGFLVAAFDYVKKNSTKEQTDYFKKHCLFGVDQDEPVIALAIVNMIFRGDGKNNIREGNCFNQHLVPKTRNGSVSASYSGEPSEKKAVTKVLMNPPFALKTEQEKEYKFIQYALEEMDDGGVLFAVIPKSVLIEKDSLVWRREQLLKNNTLLSVVTFSPELFYPLGVHTLGVFIKKGIPHPPKQSVLWIRALNDGYLKKKNKRLRSIKAEDDLKKVKDLIKGFLINPSQPVTNIPEFQKASPIDFSSENHEFLELVPEAYLDNTPMTTEKVYGDIEAHIREYVSFLIRFKKEGIAK